MIDEKPCPRCGTTKALTEFNRNRSRPDGRADWCRECMRVAAARYRRSPEAQAKHRAYAREYVKRSEVAERRRAYQMDYYYANLEKWAEWNRKTYLKRRALGKVSPSILKRREEAAMCKAERAKARRERRPWRGRPLQRPDPRVLAWMAGEAVELPAITPPLPAD